MMLCFAPAFWQPCLDLESQLLLNIDLYIFTSEIIEYLQIDVAGDNGPIEAGLDFISEIYSNI